MAEDFTKPALTFEEQVERLEKRGMSFTAIQKASAIKILESVNYYRLSAYTYPFRMRDNNKPIDRFVAGMEFDSIIRLYDLDGELRLLIFEALSVIEIQIKTAVAYSLAHGYGAFAHECDENFVPEHLEAFNKSFVTTKRLLKTNKRTRKVEGFCVNQYRDWIIKLHKDIESREEAINFLKHYSSNYNGFPRIPIWEAVEVMSFGGISKLLTGLSLNKAGEGPQRFSLFSRWGVIQSVGRSWVRALSYVRNVCAHHDRLWNKKLTNNAPDIPNSKDSPGWPKNIKENRCVCFSVCMIRQILSGTPFFVEWSSRLIGIIQEFRALNELIAGQIELPLAKQGLTDLSTLLPMKTLLSSMGFPDDWNDELVLPIKR